MLSRIALVCEASEAERQTFGLFEDRFVTEVKVQVRRGGIAAVSKMGEYLASMYMLSGANAHASGTQVRIMCEHTWRDLEHDEVAIEPPCGQVVPLWVRVKRSTVWLTVPCIAHNTVCNRQNVAVVAKPVSIRRVANLLRRYLDRVTARIEPDKVDCITLRNRHNSIQRQQASPMMGMCIAWTFTH